MTWQSALAAMDEVILDTFGGTVIYNSTSITADVNIGGSLSENSNPGGAMSRQDVGSIEVLKTDVSSPAYLDTVIISGSTWAVGSPAIIKDNVTSWHLNIIRNERPRI